ncbi:MAG: YceI family protein, partial [Chloroflexi bacterium]|nr:YceI family protein [Chloroflexota bacterium]
ITQGDAESGELALPPPPTAAPATAVPPTMAPTRTVAPTAAPTAAATRPAATQQSVAPTNTLAPAPTDEPTPAPTAASAMSGEAGQSFVIGEGSEITFTVEEELGRSPIRFDAVISSTGLSGTANLDGQPSVVTLDLHSLSSDQQYRDRYIQSRMFPDTPEAIVTVDQLPDLPQSFFDGETTNGQLDGSLQIGDTVTPLVFDVEARHDGDVINVLGRTTFTWEQLGLAKPTARSVVYLADEVRVQVLLVGRGAP